MSGVIQERKKILIVEDDLEMAKLTRKRLVVAGEEVQKILKEEGPND